MAVNVVVGGNFIAVEGPEIAVSYAGSSLGGLLGPGNTGAEPLRAH